MKWASYDKPTWQEFDEGKAAAYRAFLHFHQAETNKVMERVKVEGETDALAQELEQHNIAFTRVQHMAEAQLNLSMCDLRCNISLLLSCALV